MELFHAIYKCRLCGESFTDVSTGDEELATCSVFALMSHDKYYPKGCGLGIHRYLPHHCSDGSWALADFQGYKKKRLTINKYTMTSYMIDVSNCEENNININVLEIAFRLDILAKKTTV